MTPSFWVILIAVLAYGLLHSLLASLHIKARLRRWLGPRSERWFRLLYNFLAVLTLLPILFLPILLPDRVLYTIPAPWFLLTGILQVLCLLVMLVSLKQTGIGSFLGLRQALTPGTPSPVGLATSGLYRYVRHPAYTAGLIFIWLVPIMTCNLLAIDIGLTIYVITGAFIEERKLLGEFGQAYAEYQKKTPMLIPGLRRRKSPK